MLATNQQQFVWAFYFLEDSTYQILWLGYNLQCNVIVAQN